MADFQTSTHRSRWIFTPQDLIEKRQITNQRAVKALKQYGTTRVEVNVDGSLTYPQDQVDAKPSTEKHSPKPLNVEEERLMRVFYEEKLQQVCQAFRFPQKIQATAVIYFKRFYLQWSIMEHHPKNIILTCMYASCKIEENHVSAEEIGKGIQQDHQVILNNEMLVFQSLDFDLIVYAPYRSVEGFIDDIEDFCQVRSDQLQMLKDLQETSHVELHRTMLTDAPLLFPPAQLALAALRRSNVVHRVLDFERYLDNIISRQHSIHTTSELVESLNQIDSLVKLLHVPSAEDMKHTDRKLKYCLDPSARDEYFLDPCLFSILHVLDFGKDLLYHLMQKNK